MIANGDFEDGLKGWRVVSGSAFRGQPVEAATLSAKDVVIDGAPLVRLGGDFWHTPAFPVGHSGDHLIRTVGKPFGVLESDVFTITDPFLAFRLGGSAAAGAVIQLRVPATAVQRSKDFRALDAADPDGFVAVLQASPDGSDILHETTWSLKGKLGRRAWSVPAPRSGCRSPARASTGCSPTPSASNLHRRLRSIRRCGAGPTCTATRWPRPGSAASWPATCTVRSRISARASMSTA